MMDYEYIAEQHQYGDCQAKIDGLQAENDQLRARLHGDEMTIGELRGQVDSLRRERTAVRRALGSYYWLYDDDDQRGIEDSDALYADQGVKLVMDRVEELTAQLDEARVALRRYERQAQAEQEFAAALRGEVVE